MSNESTLQLRIEVDDKGSTKIRALGAEVKKTGDEGDRGFSKMRASLNDFDNSAQVSLGTITQLTAGVVVLGTAAGVALGALLEKSIKAASDLNETTNKFNTVFAGMTDKANSWASELQSSYGMSKNSSMDMLASLQVLNQGMGMTQGEAGKLSSDMIKLAVDLGSFNNLPTADVLDAMRSAIVGEYDPIQRFAGAINAATVEQKALSMGLAKTTDDISAAAKAQAMYQLVLESNSAAVGDFIKTSDGLANQTKQYESNIDDLTAAFGGRLMPVAADVLKQINEGLENSEGGVVGLSEVVSVKLLQALYYAVETMRFFENGWSGIKLVGTVAIDAIAQGLNTLFDGMRNLMLPLDAIFEGLVKLGALDVNPFDKIEGALDTFAYSSHDVTNQVLADIEKTNSSYDKIGSTIQNYIGQVKTTESANTAAAAVVQKTASQTVTATNTETAARQRAALRAQDLLDDIERKTKQTTLSEYEYKKWALDKEIAEMETNAAGNKKILDEIAEYKKKKTLEMMSYTDRYNSYERANLESMKDGWQKFEDGKVDADKRAEDQIVEQNNETTNLITDNWDQAMSTIESSLSDMIQEGEFSFDSIEDAFKEMLADILAAILMSEIKSALADLFDIGDSSSSLLSGLKDLLDSDSSSSSSSSSLLSGLSSLLSDDSTSVSSNENLSGTTGDSSSSGSTLGGAASTALGAYSMYDGYKDTRDGNTTTGAIKMGLGAYSTYQGLVELGLVKSGTATTLYNALAAKLGLTTAAETGAQTTALTTTTTTGAAETGAAAETGGAAAAGEGGGLAAAGAGATYAIAAVAAYLVASNAINKANRDNYADKMNQSGATAGDVSNFSNAWSATDGTLLSTIDAFKQFDAAAYNTSRSTLTMANSTDAVAMKFDEASGKWEQTGLGSIAHYDDLANAEADAAQNMGTFTEGIGKTAELTQTMADNYYALTGAASTAAYSEDQLAAATSSSGKAALNAGNSISVAGDLMQTAGKSAAAGLDVATDALSATSSTSKSVLSVADNIALLGDNSTVAASSIQSAAQQMKEAWSTYSDASTSSLSSHVVGGSSFTYHADGGIFPGPTQIGSHIFGEAGAEAILPLPDGPDTLSKIIDKIDGLSGGRPIVIKLTIDADAHIGDTGLTEKMRMTAKSVYIDATERRDNITVRTF